MTPTQLKKLGNHVSKWMHLPAMLLVAAFIFIPGKLAAQSMEDYQQMAAERNPEIRAAFQQYLAGLEESPQVGVLPDPEIAFGYFITPKPQKVRISLTQMFPWFGSLSDQKNIAENNAKAKFQAFQEARNQLFYEVEYTLMELYELERSIEIAAENLDILNSLVEISLRRYETAQASQVDVLRAQIEQEDLKTQIELLKDNRGVLIQRVNELLNRESTAKVVLPDTLNPDTSIEAGEILNDQIARRNPTLNRLRYQEDAARNMKTLAAKEGRPSFGLGVDYDIAAKSPGMAGSGKNGIMARASFRIPIFRKKYNAKVNQAEFNIQSVQSQIISQKNALETDLDASLRDYYDARRRFNLYDQMQIQRVNQALTIMMQKYATDYSDFEELLRMQRKLLDYQLSRVQALTDMQSTAAYIHYLSGAYNITPNEMNLN